MAVLSLRFQSKLLGFATAVRILIPTEWGKEFDYKAYYENKEKLPVLWLLHGGSDNYADWHDCTTVQILADQYKIAVIMPDAQNSSYSNMAFGPAWFDYMTQELPEYLYQRFPFSRVRNAKNCTALSGTFSGSLSDRIGSTADKPVCASQDR